MIKNRDFIKVDVIGRIKETDKIFEVTNEEVAKKEDLFKADVAYGPKIAIIGEDSISKGLDRHIIGMKEKETKSFTLSQHEAYGARDKNLIVTVPLKRIKQQNITPQVGMSIQTEQGIARISSVDGGRVRLDYNHPLAGKDLIFEITVLEKIEELNEKVKALIKLQTPSAKGDTYDVLIEEDSAVICPKKENVPIGLQAVGRIRVSRLAFDYLGLNTVKFEEVYTNTEKEKKDIHFL